MENSKQKVEEIEVVVIGKANKMMAINIKGEEEMTETRTLSLTSEVEETLTLKGEAKGEMGKTTAGLSERTDNLMKITENHGK